MELSAKGKQIGACFIIVAECLVIRETLAMTGQQNLQWIIIKSDSQLMVNAILDKSYVQKDIINLVEDIRKWFI